MDGIACDRCDRSLLVDEPVRYVVRIDVVAAHDPMEVTRDDLDRDLDREIRETIRRIEASDPETLERDVHFAARYDLCPACQRAFLANPLGR